MHKQICWRLLHEADGTSYYNGILLLINQIIIVRTTNVFYYIVLEILKAPLYGAVRTDPDGNAIVISLTNVGFTPDYQTSYLILDVR